LNRGLICLLKYFKIIRDSGSFEIEFRAISTRFENVFDIYLDVKLLYRSPSYTHEFITKKFNVPKGLHKIILIYRYDKKFDGENAPEISIKVSIVLLSF